LRETADLAFTSLDRYGHLEPEYYEHDFRKGSGGWGKELDRGDILSIESIQVGREWRRRGTATNMVQAVLEKTKEKVSEESGFFTVVNPGLLYSEQDKAKEYGTFFQREADCPRSGDRRGFGELVPPVGSLSPTNPTTRRES
jgi:predicted GNAT family acetyltransferase